MKLLFISVMALCYSVLAATSQNNKGPQLKNSDLDMPLVPPNLTPQQLKAEQAFRAKINQIEREQGKEVALKVIDKLNRKVATTLGLKTTKNNVDPKTGRRYMGHMGMMMGYQPGMMMPGYMCYTCLYGF